MAEVETSCDVEVAGAGDAWQPAAIAVAAVLLAALIAAVKLSTLDDPSYLDRELNVARLVVASVALLLAGAAAFWMRSIKTRLTWAALLWLGWTSTILLGALHWLGAALAAAGAVVAMMAVVRSFRRHRSLTPLVSAALPRLRAQIAPRFPQADWLQAAARTALKIDGRYRLDSGRASLRVRMRPGTPTVITEAGEAIRLEPTEISAPKLSEALLRNAGVWAKDVRWRVDAGAQLLLRGDIDWEATPKASAGYREQSKPAPRRGVLAGPLEIEFATPPRTVPRGVVAAAAISALGVVAFAATATQLQLTAPAPEAAELAPLEAELVAAEVNRDRRTIDVEIAVSPVAAEGSLEVKVSGAVLRADGATLPVAIRETTYDDEAQRLTSNISYGRASPRAGELYDLRLTLRAKRSHRGVVVAVHEKTRLSTRVSLVAASLRTYGQVACPDGNCRVHVGNDAVMASAKPGVELTVGGRKVPTDGREHRIELDVLSLFSDKDKDEITHPNTRRLPVHVRFPDGTKLTEHFDPGAKLIEGGVSDLFWPVLTDRRGVSLTRDDDPEPTSPRMVLLFYDARPKPRTRTFYTLLGAGRGLKSIDLVAATHRSFHEGSPCRFGSQTVARTWEQNVITVYRRRTAEQVASRTFRGKLPPCPSTPPTSPTVDGGDVSDDAVRSYLRSLLAR